MTQNDRDFVTMVAWKADKRYGGNVPKSKRVTAALAEALRDPDFTVELRAAFALGGFVAAKDIMYRRLVRAGLFRRGSK